MKLNPGDLFRVMSEDGLQVVEEAHPFVILHTEGDSIFFSNFTDAGKENDHGCVVYPVDDCKNITKQSAFRYRSIEKQSLAVMEKAFQDGKLRNFGPITSASWEKIKNGVLKSTLIKPKYKEVLIAAFGLDFSR